jgi:hypothetical protein
MTDQQVCSSHCSFPALTCIFWLLRCKGLPGECDLQLGCSVQISHRRRMELKFVSLTLLKRMILLHSRPWHVGACHHIRQESLMGTRTLCPHSRGRPAEIAGLVANGNTKKNRESIRLYRFSLSSERSSIFEGLRPSQSLMRIWMP